MIRSSIVAIALLALAGCTQQATQEITPASVGASAAEPSPGFPLAVESAAFDRQIFIPSGRCGGKTIPLEGAAAFDAAMRQAALAARPQTHPRFVQITAGDITTQVTDASGGIARPQMRLRARVTIEPASGPARTQTVEWTGRAYGVAGVACDGLGGIVADAYRDGLAGLADRVRERVRASR